MASTTRAKARSYSISRGSAIILGCAAPLSPIVLARGADPVSFSYSYASVFVCHKPSETLRLHGWMQLKQNQIIPTVGYTREKVNYYGIEVRI